MKLGNASGAKDPDFWCAFKDEEVHAYGLARANAGAPGVDGISFAQIEERGMEAGLAALLEELVYGPTAAFLVEMFPAKIRSTSLSLPYHLGVGILGGFLPFAASALVIYYGNIYAGLWYPVIISLINAVVGIIVLPETKDRLID